MNYEFGIIKDKNNLPIQSQPKDCCCYSPDADVLDAFKATGKDWQTKINAALKQYMKEHPLEK